MKQDYVTDTATGDGWTLMLGDSCERLAEIPDDSIDLTVYSPPFASLYTYSPSERDLGNCTDQAEFLEHYRFVVDHLLRVTKPGRICAVHVQQIALQKSKDGFMGLADFRGDVIRCHEDAGWFLFGEVTIDKDPQLQAVRTKSHQLLFVSLRRDGCNVRPAMADYLLIFKKHGDNAVPVKTDDLDNETWIKWAKPVWYDIREMSTLNPGSGAEDADERHICPLQLPLIERCVRLWSNKGETILSPFAGIGSEGHEAVRLGREFVGCELKPSYWASACKNLERAVSLRDEVTLFAS